MGRANLAHYNWLKNGDKNISYFHKIAIQRQFRGRIVELDDGNGRRISSTEELLHLAFEIGFDEHVLGLVENRVSGSMNDSLRKLFTEEEISSAGKMMAPLKAPGVDGFPAIFFQRYCHIIGPDISSYCLSILNGKNKIGDINKTHIVLIPKVEKPKNLSQFRLISLWQRVNFDKSLIYFGTNVDSITRENITSLLGVRVASSLEKYLGLPMMSNCLLAKVLKAQYYPSSDLLSAKVGSYPSFTWRSIYGARELMAEGLVWRVGSGDRINIWNDPWLPGKESNRISVQKILPNWSTVNQLIKSETNTWDKELIHNLVDEAITKRILSIPIFGANVENMLVWKYEGLGEYTMKSGYQALSTELLQINTYTSSNCVDYRGFYKSLWSLNILGKIKIHIWRLINGLLPHFCNLARRSLSTDVVCPLCKVDLEDSGHLLWNCELLQSVWASLQIQLRNKLVHEGVKPSLQELVGFIQGYGSDLSINQEISSPSPRSMAKEVWRPPVAGVFKLNFDAAFQHDLQLAVIAVIARDSEGEIVGAETYLFLNVSDACLAEARACERVLLFTVERGYWRLFIEGDSLTVIKIIQKKKKDKSVIRPITHQINLLNESFDAITYTFVPRLVKRTTHTLVMEGRRRQIFGV
ncbi:hypothetical protein PVK06_008080 [Gossypium arboreum]|uniref:Reverse transcriptase n=1 Tax=Gossypium arboreum TaxID=29729 RepID=A0ABR0QJ11_GOSAR|nr:hypothetical protein PVK06_008080 [Gossypium arboreum]